MVDKLEATVGEQCASILEEVIATGYPLPASKHDQCVHGKFGWEDCIACYDECLSQAAEQMRGIFTSTEDARERVKVLEEALEAVNDAMLYRGDGATGDYGWSITKLNRARPLIRTAVGNKETDRHG